MLHDDALLIRIHLAILVDASHVFVVALLGLDFVGEPFLQEDGEFVVEVVCFLLVSQILGRERERKRHT